MHPAVEPAEVDMAEEVDRMAEEVDHGGGGGPHGGGGGTDTTGTPRS